MAKTRKKARKHARRSAAGTVSKTRFNKCVATQIRKLKHPAKAKDAGKAIKHCKRKVGVPVMTRKTHRKTTKRRKRK